MKAYASGRTAGNPGDVYWPATIAPMFCVIAFHAIFNVVFLRLRFDKNLINESIKAVTLQLYYTISD
jgi:hypothetical protein